MAKQKLIKNPLFFSFFFIEYLTPPFFLFLTRGKNQLEWSFDSNCENNNSNNKNYKRDRKNISNNYNNFGVYLSRKTPFFFDDNNISLFWLGRWSYVDGKTLLTKSKWGEHIPVLIRVMSVFRWQRPSSLIKSIIIYPCFDWGDSRLSMAKPFSLDQNQNNIHLSWPRRRPSFDNNALLPW